MARFGANISDAHSCFIFLPARCFGLSDSIAGGRSSAGEELLEMVGSHSLSSDVIRDYRLPCETGLIGWVARHKRSIHVSPFEHDSRTLGIYAEDHNLKSFIGIPVPLEFMNGHENSPVGVIACDSKKSYAFSKLQGKLLADLASEVSNTIRLTLFSEGGLLKGGKELSWPAFIKKSKQLMEALGPDSIEIIRLKIQNFDQLEFDVGTEQSGVLVDQLFRLMQQALPPHFPMMRLPNGDVVLAVDNMMTSYFENKIRSLSEHLGAPSRRPVFEFVKRSFRDKVNRSTSMERMVAETSKLDTSLNERGTQYEYRRA
jgi:hypothetical protein